MDSQPSSGFDLVLVSMPFAPLRMPSLALSLLKSGLPGISTKVFYFGLSFADRIGRDLYDSVAYREVREPAQLGEWIFTSALFDSPAQQSEQYLIAILKRGTPQAVLPEATIEKVLAARAGAAEFVDWCAERVLECSPRLVGFTSVFQQNVASLALARRIKQSNPGVFTVFGGANCEGVMGREIIRQFPFVDAAVSGEADSVFPEIVQRVFRQEPVDNLQGVITKRALAFGSHPFSSPTIRDLDSLPYPDYDDFFEQFSASAAACAVAPRLQFETSRGCWWGQVHHCTFCGLNGATMAFRGKSERRAMDELLHLARRYPGNPILVTDNILDMNYFKNFIPELASRKLKPRLFYEVKANLKKDQLCLLRDAGILQIQPGIESLSDAVLNLMRKGIRGLQNIQLLKWCKEMGIWPSWNLIWGFPGEPAGEYARMSSLVPILTHLPPPAAARQIRMDRFSPNFEKSNELGFTNVQPVPSYAFLYPVEPEALSNLAYYFDYDYSDSRDVDAYTRPLAAAIEQWRAAHPESELVFQDDGVELTIWDLRPIAARTVTKLKGWKRQLYLACDSVRGIGWIGQNAEQIFSSSVSDAKIQRMLDSLIGMGFLIRDGDSVLSLAVRVRNSS